MIPPFFNMMSPSISRLFRAVRHFACELTQRKRRIFWLQLTSRPAAQEAATTPTPPPPTSAPAALYFLLGGESNLPPMPASIAIPSTSPLGLMPLEKL